MIKWKVCPIPHLVICYTREGVKTLTCRLFKNFFQLEHYFELKCLWDYEIFMWCNFIQSKEVEQTWRIAPLPPWKWILLIIFHLQLSYSVGWSHPQRTNNILVTSQYRKSSAAQEHFIWRLIKVQRFLQRAETLSLEPTLLVFTDKQLMSHVVVIPTKLHYR